MSGRRHLAAVPDLEPDDLERAHPSWAQYVDRDTVGPWLEAMRVGHPVALPRVVIGEPVAEPPGWWVCPSCGRRVDRADERRTITGRVCTGPAMPSRPRHEPVAMRVQR